MTNHPASAVPRWQLIGGFLIIYVVWGSTYLAIKWGVATIPPFSMAAARFLVAGSVLYAFARWRGAARPTATNWRASAVIGTLLLFVGNGAVSWASRRVSSGLTSVLVATVPLWLVLCEAWMGKRPRPLQLIGVGIGLVGVALLVLPRAGGGTTVDLPGALVLTLGSLSWTAGSLYSRSAPQAKPAPLAIGMQMLTGGGLFVLLSLALGEWRLIHPSLISAQSVASLVYLIIFGSLIGFSTGSQRSTRPRATGKKLQNGSPLSKVIVVSARVICQFMEKVKGIQSASISALIGCIASLKRFTGPLTHRS